MILEGWEIGTAVHHATGHDLGGDRAIVRSVGGDLVLIVIDVLGHGESADRAARLAEHAIDGASSSNAEALLRLLDRELAGSVGAAAGVSTFGAGSNSGGFAGVGNTVCRVLGPAPRTLVSADGVVGQHARVPDAAAISVEPGETLLMHSDGISSRIDWKSYPEIVSAGAELAAKEIVRKFGRSHDDISCIVARRQ